MKMRHQLLRFGFIIFFSGQSYGMNCSELGGRVELVGLDGAIKVILKSAQELQVTELIGAHAHTSVSGVSNLGSVEKIEILPSQKTLLLIPNDRKSINFASLEKLAEYNNLDKALYSSVTKLSSSQRRDAPATTVSEYKVFKSKINNVERTFLGVIWNNKTFEFYELKLVTGQTGLHFDLHNLIFSDVLPNRTIIKENIFETLFSDFVRFGLQMNLSTATSEKPTFRMGIAQTLQGGANKKSNLEARMQDPNTLVLTSKEGWSENFRLETNPYIVKNMGQMTTEWSSQGTKLLIKGNSPQIYVGTAIESDLRIRANMEPIKGYSADSKALESHFIKVTNFKGKTNEYVATVWSDGFFTVHAFEIHSGFGAKPKLVHQETFAPEQIQGFLENTTPSRLVHQLFDTYFKQAAKLLDPEN